MQSIHSSSNVKDPVALLIMCIAVLVTCVGILIQSVADFILTMRQMALFRFLAGYSNSYAEAYAFVTKRKYLLLAALSCTIILTTLVAIFWLTITGVLIYFASKKIFLVPCVSGAVVSMIGLLFSTFIVSQPSMFFCPALAIEERPLLQLVGWSFRILIKTFWRTLGFAQLLTVVLVLLWIMLSIPQEIVSGVDWFRIHYMGGHMKDMPHLYVEVFGSVWNSAAGMLMSPFFAFSAGFYYLDVRMRAEGLDITRRLELLASPSSRTH